MESVQDSRDPKVEGWSPTVGFPCDSVSHRRLKGCYRDILEVSKYNSNSNCPVFVLALEQETFLVSAASRDSPGAGPVVAGLWVQGCAITTCKGLEQMQL